MEIKSFSFFFSYYEAARELPDTDRAKFYDALISYALTGEEPEVEGVAKALFILVKPVIEKSRNKAKSTATSAEAEAFDVDDEEGTKEVTQNPNESQSKVNPKSNQNQTKVNSKSNESQSKVNPKSNQNQIITDKDKDMDMEEEKEKRHTGGVGGVSPPPHLSSSFDAFWDIYPKKAGKKDAFKAWCKIRPDPKTQEDIKASILRFKASGQWQKDGGAFIPHPATFLRGERWKDELEGAYTSPAQKDYSGDDDFLAASKRPNFELGRERTGDEHDESS